MLMRLLYRRIQQQGGDMPTKSFKVYFCRTSIGQGGGSIVTALADSHAQHGEHLPSIQISGDGYQVRDLTRVGTTWTGTFAKLRVDAPHIVDRANREREIPLNAGDRIVDKCHFLFKERHNLLIWQVNRNAGGLSKAEQYLAEAFQHYVALPPLMNEAQLQRVLDGRLYEVSFSYARPEHIGDGAPSWNQNAFDMMANVHAAQAKFLLRAPRGGGLAQAAKNMVRQLVRNASVEKVRVRLTDEQDPIELFLAPLRETIDVELVGRYPVAADVFQALERAHERQRGNIPAP